MGRRKLSRSLEEILETARRKYGEETLAVASEVEEKYTVTFLPTGITQVDEILGGGFPRGRISELFGPFSAGKSWLALRTIAETQRNGGVAALVDTEISYSPEFARFLGVDTSKLLLSTPEFGEEALDLVITLARKEVDIVVLDSSTSLVSKEDLKKEVEIAGFAPSVRLWNAGLSRIKPLIWRSGTTFLHTNQIRDNVGVFYGPTTTQPMGHKSRHDAALRLEVRRKEWIKKGDKRVGQVSLIRVDKAKYDKCKPHSETTVDIEFVSEPKEE